jgi:hypothetical protein
MQVYPWAWAVFSTFVTFSSFVLYNLIIAVVCDAVKMVQDKQDILMVQDYVKDKIESRHRIINLRQKLDKMSKQQMDLLLYVKLMLEQLDGIDDESKQHYEETLLLLGRTSGSSTEVLMDAIQQLDEIDAANGITSPNNGVASAPRTNKNDRANDMSLAPMPPEERKSSVSFHNSRANLPKDSAENGESDNDQEIDVTRNTEDQRQGQPSLQGEARHDNILEQDSSSIDEDLAPRAISGNEDNFLNNSNAMDDSEVFASAIVSQDTCGEEDDSSGSDAKEIDKLETTFNDEVSVIRAELEKLKNQDGNMQ